MPHPMESKAQRFVQLLAKQIVVNSIRFDYDAFLHNIIRISSAVERFTVNEDVPGSNPGCVAIKKNTTNMIITPGSQSV